MWWSGDNHVTGQKVMVSPVQHNEETNIKEKTNFHSA